MKETKNFKYDYKSKGKTYKVKTLDEEMVSFREIKKQKEHKHYRNYENALRAKNLDRLLSYEED